MLLSGPEEMPIRNTVSGFRRNSGILFHPSRRVTQANSFAELQRSEILFQ